MVDIISNVLFSLALLLYLLDTSYFCYRYHSQFVTALVEINSSRDQSIIKIVKNAFIFRRLFYSLFLSSINVSRQMSIRFNTNIFSFHAYSVVRWLRPVHINNIIFLVWLARYIICQITIMSVTFYLTIIIYILVGSVDISFRFCVPVKKSRCYLSLV